MHIDVFIDGLQTVRTVVVVRGWKGKSYLFVPARVPALGSSGRGHLTLEPDGHERRNMEGAVRDSGAKLD